MSGKDQTVNRTKILGVASSMRKNSASTKSLSECLSKAEQNGAETRMLNLLEIQLPIFSPDGNDSQALQKITEDVKWADAFILATPDYHGSMAGNMKNFLDYFWAEFAGKVFGYICASHEKGLTAMEQMRTAIRQCYGWSMPYGVSVHPENDFDSVGKITSPELQKRTDIVARDLTVYGQLIHKQFDSDLNGIIPNTFAAFYRGDN